MGGPLATWPINSINQTFPCNDSNIIERTICQGISQFLLKPKQFCAILEYSCHAKNLSPDIKDIVPKTLGLSNSNILGDWLFAIYWSQYNIYIIFIWIKRMGHT